jgi:hypothetical protein
MNSRKQTKNHKDKLVPYSYHVTDAKRNGKTKGKELENGKLEIEERRTKGGGMAKTRE